MASWVIGSTTQLTLRGRMWLRSRHSCTTSNPWPENLNIAIAAFMRCLHELLWMEVRETTCRSWFSPSTHVDQTQAIRLGTFTH